MNHMSARHNGVALTGLQAQFFRELGRGVCEGCGRLRRHIDLQEVDRQRRRACPPLPQDFVGRCEALGSASLVHVPNPAREELCAIFCDGLEGMLDGDDNWSKIAQCIRRLLLGRF